MPLIRQVDPFRRRLAFLLAGALYVSFPGAASAAAAANDAAPLAGLIRQTASSDTDVGTFYRARAYRPLWIRDGEIVSDARRVVQALRDGVDEATASGLAALVARAESGHSADLANAEIRLTRAVLALADVPAVDVGMNYIDEELEPRQRARMTPDRIQSLRDVRKLLEDLEDSNPVERQLRFGFAAYRLSWGSLPQTRVPTGAALRPGSRGTRVRALRQRLGLAERGNFDATVAQRLRAYKRAHGLPDTAVADAATITSLNRGASHYERLLRANIARAAAIPDNPGRRFILVDAASARLWMYEGGRPVDSMRVIVGKRTEQTPMMAALLRYAALNPFWNVPPDLARERIARNVVRTGESYLQQNGYQVLTDWSENARIVHPSRVDWRSVAAGRQEARVRQLPGPDNMMGRMKLMMPNRFGVYLHDTPDRHLFQEADRRLSSGCVRIEDIGRLSSWIFGSEPMPRTGQPEERVNLRRPMPVYITYLTAGPSEDGIVFRQDIYNRDATLLARLGGATRLAAQ